MAGRKRKQANGKRKATRKAVAKIARAVSHGKVTHPGPKKMKRKKMKARPKDAAGAVERSIGREASLLTKEWVYAMLFPDMIIARKGIPDDVNLPKAVLPPYSWEVAVASVQDSVATTDEYWGIAVLQGTTNQYFYLSAVASAAFTWTGVNHPSKAAYTTTNFNGNLRQVAACVDVTNITNMYTMNGRFLVKSASTGMAGTGTNSLPGTFAEASSWPGVMECYGGEVMEGGPRGIVIPSGMQNMYSGTSDASTGNFCFIIYRGVNASVNTMVARITTQYECVLNSVGALVFKPIISNYERTTWSKAVGAVIELVRLCGCSQKSFSNAAASFGGRFRRMVENAGQPVQAKAMMSESLRSASVVLNDFDVTLLEMKSAYWLRKFGVQLGTFLDKHKTAIDSLAADYEADEKAVVVRGTDAEWLHALRDVFKNPQTLRSAIRSVAAIPRPRIRSEDEKSDYDVV